MNVTLDATTPADRPVLDNLWQLYVHDFSEHMDLPLGDDGRFQSRAFEPYWADPWRHAFLLRVDGALGGLVLAQEQSRLTGASGVNDMVEFFVVRGHRRRGVGRLAAFAAFDRFRGPWEVRQQPTSVAATAFWRRIIGEYTGGAFEDLAWKDDTWTGTVQRFTSAGRVMPT